MPSTCLTCRNARKPCSAGAGQVLCILSGDWQPVMHFCEDFLGFGSFHNVKRGEGFGSCSASTTATNSLSGTISSENHHFSPSIVGAF